MVFFADRMYELRNEKGYTREELASQLGCLPKMIQDYEEGKLYPHAITMVDIADFFNVSFIICSFQPFIFCENKVLSTLSFSIIQ